MGKYVLSAREMSASILSAVPQGPGEAVKTRAHHFFDPSIQQARFVGQQIASLTEEQVVANGGERFARIRYTLDPEATLKSLERFVNDKAIGRVFGDNAIFEGITDNRVADVSFYKLADGDGVQIAKLSGSMGAMKALLARASIEDLQFTPPAFPQREPKKAEDKIVKIELEGGSFTAKLQEPAAPAPAPRREIAAERRMAPMPMFGGNPIAMKEMLQGSWTAESMAVPAPKADDMILQSLLAASHEAHPDDEVWPNGVKVEMEVDGAFQPVASPKALVVAFAAAVAGEKVAPIARGELGDRFKAFRDAKTAAPAADAAAPEVARRTPGM
jgi:hypothetical protein